jgi:hypothetical protein
MKIAQHFSAAVASRFRRIASPVGTADIRPVNDSVVPTGLGVIRLMTRRPAMNCWAIFGCPFGTQYSNNVALHGKQVNILVCTELADFFWHLLALPAHYD